LRTRFNRLHAWLYRTTGGRLLGRMGGQPVLLLTTTGRRTARPRTTPVQYLRRGETWIVVAANGGAPTPPAWLHNLIAEPAVSIQAGGDRVACTADVANRELRDELWRELIAANKWLPRTEEKAGRQLPVVVLRRRDTPLLRDGSTVHVRPIEPGDHDRLNRAVEHLSAESRYQRFFGPVRHLQETELRYFTEVDHRDHEALVAIDPDDGELVGVARYVRLSHGSPDAEVAMVVADDWHGRGLATLLLEELAERARGADIERFTATCLSVNTEAIDVLKRLGQTTTGAHDGGVTDLTIDLRELPADVPPVE
jgi:deazaflavin-dependent oxidoreductase (nitroreductase family)